MTPVRPPVWPNVPPPATGGAAKSAARGAFFQAATGAAAKPAEPRQTEARIVRDLPAEPPTKILRPGSLLDIRV